MLKTKLVSLKSIVNKLSKLKSTHSIILIGSFADGVEDESSDIDLFVVTDDISIDQVKEILYSNDYTCDSPLILTQKELIDELEKGNPNIVHYIKAGKIIKDSGLIEKIKNEKIVFSYESLIKSLE
ncbi:MAG: nucleotidyltransferase domain-containing protein, partial [Candidatus Methanomethylicaceae archaeon]